jgi:hypothetical protein
MDWDCASECPECPDSCFISKQPENSIELDSMIEAMMGSCVENIRYCGTDDDVIQRLQNADLSRLCDAISRKGRAER